MEGKKSKPKSSKKDEENEGVEHGVASSVSTTDDGPALPTDSEASIRENDTTNENEDKKNQDEPTQKIEAKPSKKRNKKVIYDQPDGQVQAREHNAMYIFAILVLIIGVGICCYIPSPTDDISIEEKLQWLTNDFQNQSPGCFKKLKSRIMPYIHHKTSPQPFVLLVASTPDNRLTAECFVTRVAKLLAASTVAINGSNYWAEVSDDAKKDIDNRLRDVFGEGKFPTVAIIHNLDLIPYGTTNLFYAYCDHDNPMYKEAAIIFTITLPQSYQISDDEVKREGLVEKYLSEHSSWVKDQNFSIDVMGALISRITDTVIVVNKESSESLEKFC